MLTVSCYALHPLIKRFVTLWRYVQVVSDCLTFLCSVLCCQCWEMSPLSNSGASDKSSIEAYKFIPEPILDTGRCSGEPFRSQHLTIDFTPQAGDTDESQQRCCEFWKFVENSPELKSIRIKPDKSESFGDTGVSYSNLNLTQRSESIGSEDLPAVHAINKMTKQGAFQTAFATTKARNIS